jgi:hypothetical protein
MSIIPTQPVFGPVPFILPSVRAERFVSTVSEGFKSALCAADLDQDGFISNRESEFIPKTYQDNFQSLLQSQGSRSINYLSAIFGMDVQLSASVADKNKDGKLDIFEARLDLATNLRDNWQELWDLTPKPL